MESVLSAYLPQDRRRALAQGQPLPDLARGVALFADISGFTPLTEALVREGGARHGAEQISHYLNQVYDALIAEIERYDGSVIGFAGDAVTCWFDDQGPGIGGQGSGDATPLLTPDPRPLTPTSLRAISCAYAMQERMRAFGLLELPGGTTVALAMKVALAAGEARRFLIGDPSLQQWDVLAGATVDRMAAAEHVAARGEIVVDEALAAAVPSVAIGEWRTDAATMQRVAVLHPHADVELWAAADPAPAAIAEEIGRRWLPHAIYERLLNHGEYLAELRPTTSLFVRFLGIDYDNDVNAGTKLDAFIRMVQRILARYEGFLLQLTVGDKGSYMLIAFGAPLAHEDDSLRAVAAAHEIAAAARRLAVFTSVQQGIAQGTVYAGFYGGRTRRTYGIQGDDVNLAARLMQQAAPGEILVSQRVVSALGGAYSLTAVGPVALKGKRQPVPIWRVEEAINIVTPHRVVPLVGREHEMAQLEAQLDPLRAGKGSVLRLVGEAGVGKTRLLEGFAERLTANGVRVAETSCQSISQRNMYTPWRALFGTLLGIDRSADTARQIQQLERVFAEYSADWNVRVPLLGDLLGLSIADNPTTAAFEPAARQDALFALTIELLARWGGIAPLVLIIEDAHWIDEASGRMALAIGRALARLPVLLVLAQRPALPGNTPIIPEIDETAGYTEMYLSELSPDSVRALAEQRLGAPLDALALALVEVLAQGNPFFVEELLATLRESMRLEFTNGTWQLSKNTIQALHDARCLSRTTNDGWQLNRSARLVAADLGIPESIHGVVLSRIDRLPETHKLSLKVASVIGHSFRSDVLAGSHPFHIDEMLLLEQIDLLERRNFVYGEPPPPNPTYAFKHAITQEVTYRTLLGSQQRELHLAVGRTLELLEPDSVDALAFHYVNGGEREKARVYLERAARKAQREYANETALSYFRQALSFEERWEWRQGEAEMLHLLGRRDEERAALVALAAAPAVPPFVVADMWGQHYEAIGDYPAAQAAVEQALAAVRAEGMRVDEMRCLAQLGLIARRQGDYAAANARYDEALVLFGDADPQSDAEARMLAQVLNGQGIVQRQLGRFDNARVSYERAMGISIMNGDRRGEAEALNGLGVSEYYQRRFAEALPYHQQALAIRRAIGDRAGEGTSLFNLALAIRDAGDYGAAQDYLAAALAIQQSIGNRWEEINVWNDLGVLLQELGDFSASKNCLERALIVCRDIGDEAGEAYILGNLGLVFRDGGDLSAAETSLSHGLLLAQKANNDYLVAGFLSHLGVVSLWAQRFDEAASRAREALKLHQAAELHLQTTADLSTLAAAELARGHATQANDYAQQSRAILDACAGVGPESPQLDYFVCYDVFAATKNQQAADESLRSAYNLVITRAGNIADPLLRRSFLERVPINRRIVAEAQRVLGLGAEL